MRSQLDDVGAKRRKANLDKARDKALQSLALKRQALVTPCAKARFSPPSGTSPSRGAAEAEGPKAANTGIAGL